MAARATTRVIASLALAGLGSFGLTACGGDDSPTTPSTNAAAPSSAASDAAAGSSSAPSAAPSSADSAPADQGDKPSQAEVTAGLKKFYNTNKPPGSEMLDLDKFSECMVEKGYNQWSTKTLNALKDGDNTGVDPKDAPSFSKLGAECGPSSLKSGAIPTS